MEEIKDFIKFMFLNIKIFFDCKEVDGGFLLLDGLLECLIESCFLG